MISNKNGVPIWKKPKHYRKTSLSIFEKKEPIEREMVRKHFERSYVLSEPSLSSSSKKIMPSEGTYQRKELLHDVGCAVAPQKNSSARETKFSRGFYRRPQTSIQQDRERSELEKRKFERRRELEGRARCVLSPPSSNPLVSLDNTLVSLDNTPPKLRTTLRTFENTMIHEEQKPHERPRTSIRVGLDKRKYENIIKHVK